MGFVCGLVRRLLLFVGALMDTALSQAMLLALPAVGMPRDETRRIGPDRSGMDRLRRASLIALGP